MSGVFSVRADPARAVLHVSVSGFLALDEVRAFAREEQDAARTLTRTCGAFDLLIETPDSSAQAQTVMATFQQLIADARFRARSIAIVATSSLLRLQLRRVLTLDHVAVFADPAAADAWLAARRSA